MGNNKAILDRAGHCDYFARMTLKVVAGWQAARKAESTGGDDANHAIDLRDVSF